MMPNRFALLPLQKKKKTLGGGCKLSRPRFCVSSPFRKNPTAHGLWPYDVPSSLLKRRTVFVGGYSSRTDGVRRSGGCLERNWSPCGYIAEISDCVECRVVAEFQVTPVDCCVTSGEACRGYHRFIIDCWVNYLNLVR